MTLSRFSQETGNTVFVITKNPQAEVKTKQQNQSTKRLTLFFLLNVQVLATAVCNISLYTNMALQ